MTLDQCVSLVHPISNPFSRNAAIALAQANLLYEIITTVTYNPNKLIAKTLQRLPENLRIRISQELERRIWIPPEGVSIRMYPYQEMLRIFLVKTGLSALFCLNYQQLFDWVCLSIDKEVSQWHLANIQGIYSYEDSAALTFKAAKSRGIRCFYDLPIPFYRMSQRIQAEEAELFPELKVALQAIQEPSWKLERKEQEIELSDHIFVASSFTQKSLLEIGVASNKISIIPYGSPIEYFQPEPKSDAVFRVLFVGRVGPRKGVHYLLQAWKELKLPEAELLLLGINEFPNGWLSSYESQFTYIAPVPHHSLSSYYNQASVLVFPSLVEGFGLVLLEAMACGIPVITTPNTGGPDMITDGVEGFIIPIRDVEALKEKLDWCYTHPEELKQMQKAAFCKAHCLTWEKYRQKLACQIQKILKSH